ncbi:MAG: hypothetical protein ACP5G6_08330, partial [Conexivisphaera sp.]
MASSRKLWVMKGSPFRARIARDGSLRVYAKGGESNSVEAERPADDVARRVPLPLQVAPEGDA